MPLVRSRAFSLTVLLLCLFGILAGQSSDTEEPASTGSTTEYCLRCHGMATLGQATSIGHIQGLSVDPKAYAGSVHAAKSCTFCHYGFNDFPHSEKALARPKPKCTGCHRGEQYADWRFDIVREEFEASVHAQKLDGKMTCFSCHDPHLFEPSRKNGTIHESVVASNAICLKCHQDTVAMAATFAVATRPLELTHAFLPNRELHWSAVRCLDCHTPVNDRMVSHKILPKTEAVRNCVECHSQESRLLTKLYRHRVQQERDQAGFLNSVVLNDAYLVGMTRNSYLDWLSIAMAIFTALGISFHAIGRYVAHKKEKRS